ncbi:hypothetical protein F5Y12DRAFT_715084 [Xylaria sp. FL1777]|nr:hypothetical protein F5Y12DRAFT_715084 [Xylaria sp. FL1777]
MADDGAKEVNRDAAGGSHSGALERVWLFYAYKIDALNGSVERTRMGLTVPEGWVECRGSLLNKCCRFDQLLDQFGGGIQRGDGSMADSAGRAFTERRGRPRLYQPQHSLEQGRQACSTAGDGDGDGDGDGVSGE